MERTLFDHRRNKRTSKGVMGAYSGATWSCDGSRWVGAWMGGGEETKTKEIQRMPLNTPLFSVRVLHCCRSVARIAAGLYITTKTKYLELVTRTIIPKTTTTTKRRVARSLSPLRSRHRHHTTESSSRRVGTCTHKVGRKMGRSAATAPRTTALLNKLSPSPPSRG